MSALSISVHWLSYVWAVSHEYRGESSLGYLIHPLVALDFGLLLRFFAQAVAMAVVIDAMAGLAAETVLVAPFGAYRAATKASARALGFGLIWAAGSSSTRSTGCDSTADTWPR